MTRLFCDEPLRSLVRLGPARFVVGLGPNADCAKVWREDQMEGGTMEDSLLLGIAGLALFAFLDFRLLRLTLPPPAGKPSLTDGLPLANAVIGLHAGILAVRGFFLDIR